MKVEVGQHYIFDKQIIKIIDVCEQYANNMSPYEPSYKRYQVVGVNQNGHKRYFTYAGIHVWLTESNLMDAPIEYSYPDRIGKYIHNIFKRIYSGATNGTI
jgi:hypothetical protein